MISLILLGLLPVFVLVIWNSLSEHNSDINASYEDTKWLARLAAAREGALIEGAHQLTIALSVLPAVVHRDQLFVHVAMATDLPSSSSIWTDSSR